MTESVLFSLFMFLLFVFRWMNFVDVKKMTSWLLYCFSPSPSLYIIQTKEKCWNTRGGAKIQKRKHTQKTWCQNRWRDIETITRRRRPIANCKRCSAGDNDSVFNNAAKRKTHAVRHHQQRPSMLIKFHVLNLNWRPWRLIFVIFQFQAHLANFIVCASSKWIFFLSLIPFWHSRTPPPSYPFIHIHFATDYSWRREHSHKPSSFRRASLWNGERYRFLCCSRLSAASMMCLLISLSWPKLRLVSMYVFIQTESMIFQRFALEYTNSRPPPIIIIVIIMIIIVVMIYRSHGRALTVNSGHGVVHSVLDGCVCVCGIIESKCEMLRRVLYVWLWTVVSAQHGRVILFYFSRALSSTGACLKDNLIMLEIKWCVFMFLCRILGEM